MNPDAYRIMWTLVLFDLPTETPGQKRNYMLFRKGLLRAGFTKLQYSVYMRHAMSREHMLTHHNTVHQLLPPEGKVCLMQFTDKQFGMTQIYECAAERKVPKKTRQLTLFAQEGEYDWQAQPYAAAAEPGPGFVPAPEAGAGAAGALGQGEAAAPTPPEGPVQAAAAAKRKPKPKLKHRGEAGDGQLFLF